MPMPMPMPAPMSNPTRRPGWALLLSAAVLSAGLALPARAANTCGMPSPSDGDSDLSLARQAEQPAGPLTCAMGYLAEKCGDHVLANRIFDKCIAKGYAGAMIWKGLMYELGNGVPHDDAAAAALYQRAATSGEGHYATLGKLHYASALHQGKGVPKDEAAARRWFEAAAAEGSEEAAEFLRTGYHTGSRDLLGHGVGVPTEAVSGQPLVPQAPATAPAVGRGAWAMLAAALAALMGLGAWRQARQGRGGAAKPAKAAMSPTEAA